MAAGSACVRADGGWERLPGTLVQAVHAMLYVRAQQLAGWLALLTVVAWLVRAVVRRRRDTEPAAWARLSRPRPPGEDLGLRDVHALWLLAPYVLSALTALAVLVLLAGRPSLLPEPVPAPKVSPAAGHRTPAAATARKPVDGELPIDRITREVGPDGKAWPANGGYVPGLAVAARGGPGRIEVRRKDSSEAVYVKLCEANSAACPGLRHAYIPARSSVFVLEDLPAGGYELRYLDLRDGMTARTIAPVEIGPRTLSHVLVLDYDSRERPFELMPRERF